MTRQTSRSRCSSPTGRSATRPGRCGRPATARCSTACSGLPLFPWTPVKAYALGDANVQVRYLNQFFLWNQAQSVEELFDIQARVPRRPVGQHHRRRPCGRRPATPTCRSVPNVPDGKARRAAAGAARPGDLHRARGCRRSTGPAASARGAPTPTPAVPGIFGPSQPAPDRRSGTTTSPTATTSFWLSNPEEPPGGLRPDHRRPRARSRRCALRLRCCRGCRHRELRPRRRTFTQDELQDHGVQQPPRGRRAGARRASSRCCRSLGGSAPTSACTAVATDRGRATPWPDGTCRDDLGLAARRSCSGRFWATCRRRCCRSTSLGIVTRLLPSQVLRACCRCRWCRLEGVPWEPAVRPGRPGATRRSRPRHRATSGSPSALRRRHRRPPAAPASRSTPGCGAGGTR